MRILVTGGAGYIGSHTLVQLAKSGHRCVTVDNLSNGHADAVLHGKLIEADIRERDRLAAIMAKERIDGVIHFAALIEAGLSVRNPLPFWEVNAGGVLSLLDAMRRSGVKHLVFSSTAALFGNPERMPIGEDDPKFPTNPYGETKLACESMIAAASAAYGLGAVCLRYFNAAGADPEARLGERHHPESHLIPLALAAASGDAPALTLNGTDYPTPDGTCLRDFVHVADLAKAHVLAMDYLAAGGASRNFNLGCGTGWSVRQVIETVERVTGRKVPLILGARRAGDPVALVADNQRAKAELGWMADFPSLDQMVEHAWAFYRQSGAPPKKR